MGMEFVACLVLLTLQSRGRVVYRGTSTPVFPRCLVDAGCCAALQCTATATARHYTAVALFDLLLCSFFFSSLGFFSWSKHRCVDRIGREPKMEREQSK
jgi:hypothetical protein